MARFDQEEWVASTRLANIASPPRVRLDLVFRSSVRFTNVQP